MSTELDKLLDSAKTEGILFEKRKKVRREYERRWQLKERIASLEAEQTRLQELCLKHGARARGLEAELDKLGLCATHKLRLSVSRVCGVCEWMENVHSKAIEVLEAERDGLNKLLAIERDLTLAHRDKWIKAEAENKALREDRERLDWLEGNLDVALDCWANWANPLQFVVNRNDVTIGMGNNLRETLDSARKAERKP